MPISITPVAGPAYRRHRPEQTVLYSVIAEHYPRLVEEIECAGGHLPSFVRQEFKDYLKCGLLEHDRFHGSKARFHRARRPTHADLTRLLDRLSRRIVAVLERRGLLVADPYLDFEPGSGLDRIQAASIHYPPADRDQTAVCR